MILADKIIEERKRCGWSQEELAARLSVSRQSVSKWESAQSTPDLQRVIQLAELFDVSTDYLLKDDIEAAPHGTTFVEPAVQGEASERESAPVIKVSMEDANEFMSFKAEAARRISIGVSLCIFCCAPLIILAGFSESGLYNLNEDTAGGIGLAILLIMVAIAVFLFVTSSMMGKRFEEFEHEAIETAYGVTGLVKERQRASEPALNTNLAIGIVLCVLSVVPIALAGATGVPDHIATIFIGMLFAFIAAGVNLIVRSSIIKGGYDVLLQEGDYTTAKKSEAKRLGPAAGIYWGVVLTVYLAWSLITMDWENTWIIWPVAAVFFGVFAGVVRLVTKGK